MVGDAESGESKGHRACSHNDYIRHFSRIKVAAKATAAPNNRAVVWLEEKHQINNPTLTPHATGGIFASLDFRPLLTNNAIDSGTNASNPSLENMLCVMIALKKKPARQPMSHAELKIKLIFTA